MRIGIQNTDLLKLSVETEPVNCIHFHEDIELIMVLEGKMSVHIEGKSHLVKAEDCLLINSNRKHRCDVRGKVYYLSLIISYKRIRELLSQPVIEFWCNSTVEDGKNYDELRQMMCILLNSCVCPHEFDILEYYSLSYQLIKLLTEKFLIYKGKNPLEPLNEDEVRYMDIVNFIQDNYRNRISLQDLADKVHLTSAYLSKYIKKTLGSSFVKYLNDIRLQHAVQDLLCSDASITKVAYDNGFPNMASFNKCFRETYGDTPSVYKSRMNSNTDMLLERERLSIQKEETIHKVNEYLDRHPEHREEQGQAVRSQIQIDVRMGERYEKNWSRVINAGAGENLLRSEMQEHIMALKEELHFEYIRFWDIFGNGMHVSMKKKNGYNFLNVYRILDFLVKNGIKPYIELGFKPRQIIKSISNTINIESEIYVENVTELALLLECFMSRIIHRYGVEEVNTWFFESWQDPRLCLEGNGTTYFEVFDATYEAVKRHAPKARVGGAGISVSDPKARKLENIIELWKKRGKRPDFLSVYVYPYIMNNNGGEVETRQSTDTDFLKNQVDEVIRCLTHGGFAVKELHVTEWSFTLSNRNYMNDSCYKAAYLVKSLIQSIGRADVLAYFAGTDLLGDYYDTNSVLYGGAGLISQDGIKKPAFYAFQFMNHLGNRLLYFDEYSIITADDDNGYRIVCYNYKKLNYQYFMKDEEAVEVQVQEKYFEEEKQIELNICLDGIVNGHYKIKTRLMNKEYGSVLDEWIRMDMVENIDPDDVRYLKQVCIPKQILHHEKVDLGSISIKTQLEAHEIQYIHVEYRGI